MKSSWIAMGLVVLFTLPAILFIRYEIYLNSVQSVTENYLKNLANGDYEKAFEYVGYFDRSSR